MASKPSKNVKKTVKKVWMGQLKPGDAFMQDARDTDVIIPVIGITGVGKSTFINTLLGEGVASVGHDLKSHTDQIQHLIFTHPHNPKRRVVIIDTPGFDHTTVNDGEILRRIAVWLAQSYNANMKLAGIVYLHEISQGTMPPVQKNLDMFKKLCGPGAIKNVVLATTKWSDVPKEVAERREKQLKDQYWKDMLDRGSRLHRFEATQASAQAIVEQILAWEPIDAVQIQQEMVDLDKLLAETEAGRSLRFTLRELLEIQQNATERLESQEDAPELHRRVIETDHKIRAIFGQIREMNIPLPKKFMRWVRS